MLRSFILMGRKRGEILRVVAVSKDLMGGLCWNEQDRRYGTIATLTAVKAKRAGYVRTLYIAPHAEVCQ